MTNSNVGPYDFLAPSRIVFGWGRRIEVGQISRPLGRRAFLVHGSKTLERSGAIDGIVASLAGAGIETIRLGAAHREPTVEDVDRLVGEAHRHSIGADDFVVAIGGGSAIDLGKAIAALAAQSAFSTTADYLEGRGTPKPLVERPLPSLAIPTTGGTGSEATKNAVIALADPPVKRSLRSNDMVPRAVLIDPELSVGVSRETTAWTALDCITQLIEAYISRRAQPIPRALCVEGLRRALPAAVAAFEDGTQREPREALAHAAMLSGMALANSGLGMAHGVAAALGALVNAPHGLACAAMLCPALRVNRDHCIADLAELSRQVLPREGSSRGTNTDEADRLIDEVQSICDRVGVPRRLSALGVTSEHISPLVQLSRGNSMNGNPRELSDDELRAVLEEML